MIGKFLTSLLQSAPAARPAPAAQLALAALLVRVARADGVYDAAEADQIDRLLADRYAISAFAAVDLRKTAEEFEAEAPDTVRFTRALKDAVPFEDRITLMEALWSVALTDGTRNADEDAALRLVASLLGINDRDSALARQRMDRS